LFLIGEKKLKGFGSGGNPSIGRDAFAENKADVEKILSSKTDILFIIAGLGKGTGSGVSPEIAKIARANNITTVAIVTIPSINVEGRKVYENSLESYSELEKSCDSLCAISNEKIISTAAETAFFDQLSKGNKEIGSTISDFVDIVTSAGKLNIDYHDLESFLKHNKYFFHTLIVLDKVYNYENLNTLITDAISKSYSNINFELADIEVIVNFKINSGTQSKLIEDTKNILEKISNNSNIKLIYGIEETSTSDNVEISLFISNSHQMQQSSGIEKNSGKTMNVKSLLDNDVENISTNKIKYGDTTKITRKLFD
jgi:cell division protein FtsZ